MSFTEIRRIGKADSVELSVKVFTNDFSAAAARFSRVKLGADSLIDRRNGVAYLKSRLRISSKGAAPIVLVSCGVERVNDMLRFCFRAAAGQSRSPIQISNAVMTEIFHDQVNVVQSVDGKRRASRMFVRGDGWKAVL